MIEGVLGQAKSRLDKVKYNASQHEKRISDTQRLLLAAEVKLEAATDEVNGHDAFMMRLKDVERKQNEEAKEQRIEEDSIQRKAYELKQLEIKRQAVDTSSDENHRQRMSVLANMSSDAAKAYHFYLKHKQEFKGKVYVPIMDIVFKSPDAIRLAENSISARDQAIFLCTNREDELRLVKNNPWRISTSVVSVEKIHSEEINAVLPDDLKELAFKCLVSEWIEAPAPLKQYLCNTSGFHRIPYGVLDESKLEHITRYLEEHRWEVFLTNDTRFQLKRSEYSRNSIQTQSAMRVTHLWHNKCYLESRIPKVKKDDGLTELVQNMKAEIDARNEALQRKRRETQKERDQIRQAGLEWKSKKQVQTKWRVDVDTHKRALHDLKNETFDIETAEKEYEKAEKSIIGKTKIMLENCVEGQDFSKKRKKLTSVVITRPSEKLLYGQGGCTVQQIQGPGGPRGFNGVQEVQEDGGCPLEQQPKGENDFDYDSNTPGQPLL
uniref:SMC hinge domain-containing protein n=1 Tax=Caenorhabditis tropicalis TaxID=1561998 RepID=A0A1I7U8P6_9PELO